MHTSSTTHRRAALAVAVAAAVASAALTAPAAGAAPRAKAPHTEPISVTPEGKAGNGVTRTSVISRNGRHIALTSDAEDLDPNVPHSGMYVRDPQTGKLRFAGFGGLLAILNDGRYVYIEYSANKSEIWIHTIGSGERVGFGLEIPEGFTGLPAGVSVSPNGRYAVYTLQETAESNSSVVFLRDRVAGTTQRISHPRPTWEARNAFQPTVSDDGRRVVYQYNYMNGPRGDDWGDVWMYDRTTGKHTQIDRSHDGSPTEKESLNPSISGNGRTVVFESRDTHLVPGDTDVSWNVFVHDIRTGTNQRVHGTQGGPGEVYTRNAAISADGRYLTFTSEVTEAGSQYGKEYPVYLRDLKKGTTTLVTPDTSGGTASADVLPGRIADGARRILFESSDPTLIPAGDTNDGADAFVRHLR
ncbi:TolB family protein [Streptomyces sp. NPDC020898]|uniref:TolB family protein n=1 Tax=Streptomyces sp. NPDC020898 TaxID=3365101 RepID=UPI00378C45E6